MQFGYLCRHLSDRLRPDGDSRYAIPDRDVTTWIVTPFGAEVARLACEFVMETYSLYKFRQAVTLTEDVQDYNLMDSNVCAGLIFEPKEVRIGSGILNKSPNIVEHVSRETSTSGTPYWWAETGEGQIRFDCPVADDTLTCDASGFADHPVITSDATVVQSFTSRTLGLFAPYAEASLRESVAADGVGIDRLNRFDQKAYAAMMRFKGENVNRYIGLVSR